MTTFKVIFKDGSVKMVKEKSEWMALNHLHYTGYSLFSIAKVVEVK